MRPPTLIQKLFAIERAIGHATNATLRAMVIDAQETVLRMELEHLHDSDTIQRHIEQRLVPVAGKTSERKDNTDYPRSA